MVTGDELFPPGIVAVDSKNKVLTLTFKFISLFTTDWILMMSTLLSMLSYREQFTAP